MAITVDSFRNMANGITLSTQGHGEAQQLAQAGRFHSLGTAFHVNASIRQNINVVNSLRQAIASDARYAGIKEHAKGLIDGIRTDKPIKSSQIKELVAYLDSLTTPKEQANMYMSRAIASAHQLRPQQDVQPGAAKMLFGTPPALDNASETVKKAYCKGLEQCFRSEIKDGVDLAQIDPTRIQQDFESRAASLTHALENIALPKPCKEALMTHVFSKNMSQDQTDLAVQHATTLAQHTGIDDKNKLSAINYIFSAPAESGTVVTTADFARTCTVRTSMSSCDAFISALKNNTTIDDALQGIGLHDIAYAKGRILKAIPLAAQKDLMAFKLLTAEDYGQKLDAILTAYTNASDEIGARVDTADELRIALRGLEDIHETPKAGYFTALKQAADALPQTLLTDIMHAPSASSLHNALTTLTKSIAQQIHDIPAGIKPDMGSFNSHARMQILGHMLSQLPEPARQQLTVALTNANATNLNALYNSNDVLPEPTMLSQTMSYLTTQLARHAQVEPHHYPYVPDFDASTMPHEITARYSLPFTGSANVAGLPHGNPTQLMDRASHYTDSLVQLAFQDEMLKFMAGSDRTTFDKDIVRNMEVTLPNGQRLTNDPVAARNELASMVTGGRVVAYDSLSPQDRIKTDTVLALLSQETEKAAMYGVAMSMDPNGEMQFMTSGPKETEVVNKAFTIESDGNDGFFLTSRLSSTASMVVTGAGPTEVAPHSTASYSLHMHLSSNELTRLAEQDWTTLTKPPHFSSEAMKNTRGELNQHFCINGDIHVGAAFNFIAAIPNAQ